MARYNEILVGHVNRGLQKHLQMKGEPPAPQLSSEIQTALNLFSGVENRYIFGWNKFSLGSGINGGVAQFSASRLRNPSTSNAVAVIESLIVAVSSLSSITVGQGPVVGDLATVATGQRLDARKGATGLTGAIVPSITTNSGGAFSPQIGIMPLVANTPFQIITTDDSQLPLLPGDAIQVDCGTANIQLYVWWMWRERFLEESERT